MTIEPIGGAARNFLRQVRMSQHSHCPDKDEIELAMICMAAGYLRRTARLSPDVVITADGISYLDQMARCE